MFGEPRRRLTQLPEHAIATLSARNIDKEADRVAGTPPVPVVVQRNFMSSR